MEGSNRYLSPSFVELLSQEWEERRKDKLNYRYPGVGGESYQVLTTQLELCVWLNCKFMDFDRETHFFFVFMYLVLTNGVYHLFGVLSFETANVFHIICDIIYELLAL